MGWKIRETPIRSGSRAQLKALQKQRRVQQSQPKKPKQPKLHKVDCQYCGREARLVHSSVVYGRNADYGMVWYCRPCKAWVGCQKNNENNAPLGRLANAALRNAKVQVHLIFDPLWDGENTRFKTRTDAYTWLSQQMQLHKKQTHVGWFNIDKCDRAIRVCNEELRRMREEDGMEGQTTETSEAVEKGNTTAVQENTEKEGNA